MENDAGSVVDVILGRCRPGREIEVLDVRIGPYWTVVRTSAGAGMASTMAGQSDRFSGFPVGAAGRLLDRDLRSLTGFLRSESAPEAAIGLAAVNSLVDLKGFDVEEIIARDILIKRGRGKAVAMIGRFPFADQIRDSSRELWVFEKDPGRRPDDLGPEHVADILPHAEIVAISATTLINHTLEEILPFVNRQAFTVMLGPSTPMMPCLFDFGIDLLCGSVIEDPAAVIRAVGQGAVTRQIPGVRRVTLSAGSSPV
jgi:uncharacterized protein (DUF4213/DUF364 family)